jgi:hypothetical protein
MGWTRRKFNRAIAELLGLGACCSAGAVMEAGGTDKLSEDSRDLIKGISTRPLQSTADPTNPNAILKDFNAEAIIETFRDAPSGNLMLYYQLFWPIFIRADQVLQRVVEFGRLYEDKRREKEKYERWHRVRVLPAVAAAHALGLVDDKEEKDVLQNLIVRTHEVALDPGSDPNREVLEIIWQNMTAALIRNRGNWEVFEARPHLVTQAEAVCKSFLAGERVLLHAAMTAWQFLLTYERALMERRDALRLAEVRAVRESVMRLPTSDVVWLKALDRLYSRRREYIQMLPQVSEILIGRQRYEGIVDLFTLARLHTTHSNFLLAEGKHYSPYTSAERARKVVEGSLNFLSNYGVVPQDWQKLKTLAENNNFFSEDGVKYLDHIFKEYNTTFSASEFEKRDIDRIWLAQLVPFRNLDEETAFRLVRGPRGEDYVRRLILNASCTVTGLVGLLKGPAEEVAKREAKRRNIDLTPTVLREIEDKIEEEKLPAVAERYLETLEYIQEGATVLYKTTIRPGLDKDTTTSIVKLERSFPREGKQECVGGDLSNKTGSVPLLLEGRADEQLHGWRKLLENENDLLPEVQELATQVLDAFCNLLKQHSDLVVLFNEAFEERAQRPGFFERDGLASALAGLLSIYPEKHHYDPSYYKNYVSNHPLEEQYLTEIANHFNTAVRAVAEQYPDILIWLEEHRQKKKVSMFEFLRGLLAHYVDNKEVEPFPI